MPARSDTAAVILAGGRGLRMGGALKALVPLNGRPLLAHVLDRLAPQTDVVAVSANDPAVGTAAPGLPLLADAHEDRRGPLAGILAGLTWALARNRRWLVSLPVDCPFIPTNLVGALRAEADAGHADVVIARSAGQAHPTAALWKLSLRDELARTVAAGRDLSVRRFFEAFPHRFCDFPASGIDPFFNVNTPADLALAENAVSAGKNLESVVPRDADQHHPDGLGLADGEARRR
jgi:molybdenum cofactor guanylyltransferase